MIDLAQTAFDTGDFRWAATLLDHAVFTDPDHAQAKSLYADTLEQLGYGAENGPWRNFFLSGATELRDGNFGTPTSSSAPAIVAQLTAEQLFYSLAIAVNGPKAWDLDLVVNITFTDLASNYVLTLRNGVLISTKKDSDPAAAATVTLTKARMLALLAGDSASAGIELAGDPTVVTSLLGVLEQGNTAFNIVTP